MSGGGEIPDKWDHPAIGMFLPGGEARSSVRGIHRVRAVTAPGPLLQPPEARRLSMGITDSSPLSTGAGTSDSMASTPSNSSTSMEQLP